jgi:hypothetical protein
MNFSTVLVLLGTAIAAIAAPAPAAEPTVKAAGFFGNGGQGESPPPGQVDQSCTDR